MWWLVKNVQISHENNICSKISCFIVPCLYSIVVYLRFRSHSPSLTSFGTSVNVISYKWIKVFIT